MDIKLINLQDLMRLHLYDSSARNAFILLEGNDNSMGAAISSPHIHENQALLDSLDELLTFYALCEIAALAQVIPQNIPTNFAQHSLRVPRNPSVKRYSASSGPELLLKMFRRRLDGVNRLHEASGEASVRIFFRFLDLARDGSQHQHLGGWSLRYLRSSGRNQLNDKQIAELTDFSIPEQFSALPPLKQTQLEERLLGFRNLMLFCQEFEHFLNEIADFRLIQSAIWHYEFFNIDEGRLKKLMSSVFRGLSLWPDASDQLFPQGRESILRLARSGEYSITLSAV